VPKTFRIRTSWRLFCLLVRAKEEMKTKQVGWQRQCSPCPTNNDEEEMEVGVARSMTVKRIKPRVVYMSLRKPETRQVPKFGTTPRLRMKQSSMRPVRRIDNGWRNDVESMPRYWYTRENARKNLDNPAGSVRERVYHKIHCQPVVSPFIF
jgi:hypothetical protein